MITAEKVAQMQASKQQGSGRAALDYWRMPNGKWQHCLGQGEFDDEVSCATDLRFCREWGCE